MEIKFSNGKHMSYVIRTLLDHLPASVQDKLGEPSGLCEYARPYALKDYPRTWIQTYPWSRLRGPSEIPGYDGTTGVTFKNLKFPAGR